MPWAPVLAVGGPWLLPTLVVASVGLEGPLACHTALPGPGSRRSLPGQAAAAEDDSEPLSRAAPCSHKAPPWPGGWEHGWGGSPGPWLAQQWEWKGTPGPPAMPVLGTTPRRCHGKWREASSPHAGSGFTSISQNPQSPWDTSGLQHPQVFLLGVSRAVGCGQYGCACCPPYRYDAA